MKFPSPLHAPSPQLWVPFIDSVFKLSMEWVGEEASLEDLAPELALRQQKDN